MCATFYLNIHSTPFNMCGRAVLSHFRLTTWPAARRPQHNDEIKKNSHQFNKDMSQMIDVVNILIFFKVKYSGDP